MKLEELKVYKLSMEQLIKAIDSVAANLSEGFGRYFYKENR